MAGRIRRPQTYPAMLRDVCCVLNGLKDGTELKRSLKGYYVLCGYVVQFPSTNVINFLKYDTVFLKIRFMNPDSTLKTEVRIKTDTWAFRSSDNIAWTYKTVYEMPMSKDEHFNAQILEDRFPEWEDLQYLNVIHKLSLDLKIEDLILESEYFYQ